MGLVFVGEKVIIKILILNESFKIYLIFIFSTSRYGAHNEINDLHNICIMFDVDNITSIPTFGCLSIIFLVTGLIVKAATVNSLIIILLIKPVLIQCILCFNMFIYTNYNAICLCIENIKFLI